MSRRLPLLFALLGVLAMPASAYAIAIGIGDQKPDMFADSRFHALGIRYARYLVGWDSLTNKRQTRQIDTWMGAAHFSGVQPLVTFAHSLLANRRRVLPSPARFRHEFLRFRHRYPWVTTFATWNEANHCGEPVCHKPQLAAAYYNQMRSACPHCTLLAAEVLDEPNMVEWIQAFERKARGNKSRQIWGVHNYLDANRLRTVGTRRLLAHTRGLIWFTETGGIVKRRNRSTITFPESAAHAAEATQWVFRRLVPLSPRITRVYFYNWNNPGGFQTWDSGLIASNGRARPAFDVLQREIHRVRPGVQ
jgi:hypothetical protein